MLNSAGLILLSELPPRLLPMALRLFADYDFSAPRLLRPELLDTRYEWKPGTAMRLLVALTDCGLLVGSRLIRLAPQYGWTPGSLAEQWTRLEKIEQREATV
jgi:hypothetical protein